MINIERLPHPTYLPYPNHYTAAFFHSENEAAMAIEYLETKGYEHQDFNVFDGERGIEAVDIDGLRHTLVERFMRRFIKFSDSAEWRFLNEADQELRNGNILVCIPTPRSADKAEVVNVLKEYGGYDLRFFTPIYIEEVE